MMKAGSSCSTHPAPSRGASSSSQSYWARRACDDTAATPPSAATAPLRTEVAVFTAGHRNLAIKNELPGRTSAYRVAEVRPQVNGIILKRLFREGATVKAGEPLYQIDPARYEASRDLARADLKNAEAGLKLARLKEKRYTALVAKEAVSRQTYDEAIAAVEQGEAKVAAAKANLELAQINLNYTKVTSPISGRIGKSAITEGSLVTANQQTALATVTQLDPIYVDVTQSSVELLKLRKEIAEGKLVGADETQAPVSLMMEDGSPYPDRGRLQFSDVTVDESTGSIRLRALFPNPRMDLLPGLFVRAAIRQAGSGTGDPGAPAERAAQSGRQHRGLARLAGRHGGPATGDHPPGGRRPMAGRERTERGRPRDCLRIPEDAPRRPGRRRSLRGGERPGRSGRFQHAPLIGFVPWHVSSSTARSSPGSSPSSSCWPAGFRSFAFPSSNIRASRRPRWRSTPPIPAPRRRPSRTRSPR